MTEIFSGILLILYFAGVGMLLEKPLVLVFHFNRTFRSKLLGAFFAFILVAWLAGLAVLFYKIDLLVSILILALVAAVGVVEYFTAKKYDIPDPHNLPEKTPAYQMQWLQIGLTAVFFILVVYGFYLLISSSTHSAVLTPWQTIKPIFIYIFALAAFIIGVLICTKFSHKYLLVYLIALSFLQHSYLPLTSELLYGADSWRHIATEERILRGEQITSPVISDGSPKTQLTTLIGTVAYSQMWGVSVLFSKVMSLDLITINKWLMPILWSLILPVILFEIGRSFGWSRRRSLVLVWLSLLPFAWQVGGAFTLPVNFGFLVWLFAQMLMFKRSERPETNQLIYLVIFGVIISFGYTLYALIFWAGMLLFELIRWRLDFTRVQVGVMILFGALLLPLVEWKFGYGFLSSNISFWDNCKQTIGTFTGYYLASGPRPHDITTGNIIINQTPAYAFVKNIFISSRWWIVAFMTAFWFLFIYGIWASLQKGFESLPDYPGEKPVNIHRSNYCWLLIFGLSLLLGYIISRYFLPGEHLLTRRLDPVLAFLILTIFFVAVSGLSMLNNYKYIVPVAFLIGTAILSASYSLGPDTRSVGTDEFKAVNYIAEQTKSDDKYCVVGNTYVLLALEASTRGRIVGGGFPISHNFEQPELSKLQMNLDDISVVQVREALKITGAKKCYLITKTDGLISYFIVTGKNTTSTEFNSIKVWEYSY